MPFGAHTYRTGQYMDVPPLLYQLRILLVLLCLCVCVCVCVCVGVRGCVGVTNEMASGVAFQPRWLELHALCASPDVRRDKPRVLGGLGSEAACLPHVCGRGHRERMQII